MHLPKSIVANCAAIILLLGGIDPVSMSAGIQQAAKGSETSGGGARSGYPGSSAESLILDGVKLVVHADQFPSETFTLPASGAADQIASSIAWEPYREFSITAIPFGRSPGTEALPRAASGGRRSYEAALRSYRTQQGGKVQDGPSATLFGKQVTAVHSVVPLYIDGPVQTPVVIDEWVIEAGSRLWLVRASQEQTGADARSADFATGLTIDSQTLGNASTLDDSRGGGPSQSSSSPASASALPTPAWWNGDCDNNTYLAKSGVGSYRLGAVYLGMPACGPRPFADHGPDVLVRFFSGAWGEYEWECVELTMRFLYLMYGISPYQANGSQVVWNYSGSRLIKVANGSVGLAPKPNDVLSYGATSTFGHASVVMASSVDANGNGTITVIEENNSASGSSTLAVSNWWVSGNAGAVSGWLHDASADTGNVKVAINGSPMGAYNVPSQGSMQSSFAGVNNGPVKVFSSDGVTPLVASERVIMSNWGVPESFTEMMGVPNSQLDTTYWMPWYNNVDLDTQLRFGNVSGSSATVHVYIAGKEMLSGCTPSNSPYSLAPGSSIRVGCAGINDGPVKIESDVNIVAAERVIYNIYGTRISFSELMGVPNSQLDKTYWMPWFDNSNDTVLDSQLRFGNVSGSTATVRVYIGGVEMTSGCTPSNSPYTLLPGSSIRVACAGVKDGPVKVDSTVPIVAAERLIYAVNGMRTSFSEMMGLPNVQLDSSYWMPWYNNVDLDTQLRIGAP